MNKKSNLYNIKRKHSRGTLFFWRRELYKDKRRNMPLWAVLEILKKLSKNKKEYRKRLEIFQKEIVFYTSQGRGIHISTKFPIQQTPELISIIFHLCGDGHIGKKESTSHYTQMNLDGLTSFKQKLLNIFGYFDINENVISNGRINIPRVISDFYNEHFDLCYSKWDTARIPKNTLLTSNC